MLEEERSSSHVYGAFLAASAAPATIQLLSSQTQTKEFARGTTRVVALALEAPLSAPRACRSNDIQVCEVMDDCQPSSAVWAVVEPIYANQPRELPAALAPEERHALGHCVSAQNVGKNPGAVFVAEEPLYEVPVPLKDQHPQVSGRLSPLVVVRETEALYEPLLFRQASTKMSALNHIYAQPGPRPPTSPSTTEGHSGAAPSHSPQHLPLNATHNSPLYANVRNRSEESALVKVSSGMHMYEYDTVAPRPPPRMSRVLALTGGEGTVVAPMEGHYDASLNHFYAVPMFGVEDSVSQRVIVQACGKQQSGSVVENGVVNEGSRFGPRQHAAANNEEHIYYQVERTEAAAAAACEGETSPTSPLYTQCMFEDEFEPDYLTTETHDQHAQSHNRGVAKDTFVFKNPLYVESPYSHPNDSTTDTCGVEEERQSFEITFDEYDNNSQQQQQPSPLPTRAPHWRSSQISLTASSSPGSSLRGSTDMLHVTGHPGRHTRSPRWTTGFGSSRVRRLLMWLSLFVLLLAGVVVGVVVGGLGLAR
eukprot:m.239252 g.239252  ORF g.239252 m.239252 type:complete len:536 (-) comp22396_c0_seq1:21-1628(-)